MPARQPSGFVISVASVSSPAVPITIENSGSSVQRRSVDASGARPGRRRRPPAAAGARASSSPGSAARASNGSERSRSVSAAGRIRSQPSAGAHRRWSTPERLPLDHDRHVARLLQLDQRDAGADRVQRARGDEQHVAGGHRDLVERVQHHLRVLLGDPAPERRRGRSARAGRGACARPARRRGSARPRSCRSRELQVCAGELAAGMEVHGEALAGVEQLDQQAGVRTEARRRARARGSRPGRRRSRRAGRAVRELREPLRVVARTRWWSMRPSPRARRGRVPGVDAAEAVDARRRRGRSGTRGLAGSSTGARPAGGASVRRRARRSPARRHVRSLVLILAVSSSPDRCNDNVVRMSSDNVVIVLARRARLPVARQTDELQEFRCRTCRR